MPRVRMGKPRGFAMRFSQIVREEVLNRGGDLSGRWLAGNTSFSKTYAYERLNFLKPYNMNDVEELAGLFEQSVDEFVNRALRSG